MSAEGPEPVGACAICEIEKHHDHNLDTFEAAFKNNGLSLDPDIPSERECGK